MQNTSELRNDSQARALRVFAGNGFGDAAIGRTEPHVLLTSVELYHLARAHRSYQLREIVNATLQAAGDFWRRMVTRWKRQQCARATYSALRALDPRILRDLGFHRSELFRLPPKLPASPIPRALLVRHSRASSAQQHFTGEHRHV